MNKKMILKILLVLFPVLAVGLATTVDSVTVFDTVTRQTQYYSYFDILPVGDLKLITPLAGLLAAASGIAAAVYMARKKGGALKAAGWLALASACVAAVPVLLRGQILVIPNVGLPILMVLEYVDAYYLGKEKQEPAGASRKQDRLPRR